MKIAVFDVSNGSCALAVCSNGYSIMIDCGSHADKGCPIDRINNLRKTGEWLSDMKDFTPTNYFPFFNPISYPLTKLVITHPDLDHIKNIVKVHQNLTPYLLHRRYIEEFPRTIVELDHEGYDYYRDKVCAYYRNSNPETINWGLRERSWEIPMNTLLNNLVFGETKLKNNSSLIYFLEYNNFRILFCGDMEVEGWDWLIDTNYQGFNDEMSKGVDVIIASHHGHSSGYSLKLMKLIGAPKLSILSKGSESDGETDVDPRYSAISTGFSVLGLTSNNYVLKKTLTTRSNGNIYVDFINGVPRIMADLV